MGKKYKDFIGKRFGKLTILEKSEKTDRKKTSFFICQCDCGNKTTVRGHCLTSGDTKSCGCGRKVDVLHKKFYRLTVLKEIGKDLHGSITYECLCDCGNISIVRGNHLVFGTVKSCGCIRKEEHSKYILTVRKEEGYSSFRMIYLSHKNRAKKRNLTFELTEEEAKALFEANCHYCGSSPSNVAKVKNGFGKYVYSGIDRVDSQKGYIFDNCVACCWRCNFAKLDSPIEEFDEWIKQIYHNRFG